jgi:2-oxoglutarate ferredoxin oxidoreductase subunit beta
MGDTNKLTMKKVYCKPESLKDTPHLYCPGCGHGIIHRLIAEAIDELGVREKTIAVAPVGCAVFAYDYFNFDVTEAPHGRPPAVATGIKRVMPDKFVFTYQGDGDLASIGMAETIHSANRGENITIIFVNNANYGMTGGQMAPTTLIGMKTATSPFGRDPKREGYPMKVCELLATLEGVSYLERVAVNNVKNILNTKKAIKKAFQKQIDGKGFSLIEVLSQCPVDWDKPPQEAVKWVDEVFMKTFPLGVYKDKP